MQTDSLLLSLRFLQVLSVWRSANRHHFNLRPCALLHLISLRLSKKPPWYVQTVCKYQSDLIQRYGWNPSINRARVPKVKRSHSCVCVCVSTCAPGGVHGQPVRGGAELRGRPTSTHPQPLLQPRMQPLRQPLLQSGGAAGRPHQLARLREVYFYGEAVEPCERPGPDCVGSLRRGIGTFGTSRL